MVRSSDDPRTKYIFDFLLELKPILQPGLNISYQNPDLYTLGLFFLPPVEVSFPTFSLY